MNATVQAPEEETTESTDTRPAATETSNDELRKEAIASLKRKRKFVQDAVGYVTVNGVLWLIWVVTERASDGTMPWPAWVSAIWGFLLAVDAWRAFGTWPASLHGPITEAEIEREIRRSRGSRS